MENEEICRFLAEKLMGYKNIRTEQVRGILSLSGQYFPCLIGDINDKSEMIPDYTNDLNAAFSVAEVMEKLDFEWGLHYEGSRTDSYIGFDYVVCFGGGGDTEVEQKIQAIDKNPAKAISLAAIKSLKHFNKVKND
jgi:hypothetical protein